MGTCALLLGALSSKLQCLCDHRGHIGQTTITPTSTPSEPTTHCPGVRPQIRRILLAVATARAEQKRESGLIRPLSLRLARVECILENHCQIRVVDVVAVSSYRYFFGCAAELSPIGIGPVGWARRTYSARLYIKMLRSNTRRHHSERHALVSRLRSAFDM